MTDKKGHDEYRERVLKNMALSESDINKNINKVLLSIITACMGGNKNDFTFSKNKSIENKVDKIINNLSTSIYNSAYDRAKKAVEESFKQTHKQYENKFLLSFMALNIGKKTIYDRINYYLSNFKYEIEAYVAIGLSKNYSATKISQLWNSNKKNPYGALIFKQNKGKFSSKPLSKGVDVGSGYTSSSFVGLKDLEMNNTFQAYNYALNEIWKEDDDIVGWYTIRGSNYPCEECDSHVHEFHNKRDMFYGYHPRCCCIMIPITDEE